MGVNCIHTDVLWHKIGHIQSGYTVPPLVNTSNANNREGAAIVRAAGATKNEYELGVDANSDLRY